MCRTNAKIAGSGAVSDPCTSSTLCYPVVALLMELFILVNAINSRVSQSYLWIFLFFFFCLSDRLTNDRGPVSGLAKFAP